MVCFFVKRHVKQSNSGVFVNNGQTYIPKQLKKKSHQYILKAWFVDKERT